jgi:hypothetical protein
MSLHGLLQGQLYLFTAFWVNRRFGEIFRLHLNGKRIGRARYRLEKKGDILHSLIHEMLKSVGFFLNLFEGISYLKQATLLMKSLAGMFAIDS